MKGVASSNSVVSLTTHQSLLQVPSALEIGFVPRSKVASQFPGIFLFTDIARLIRPVRNLMTDTVEYIGTFEQVNILLDSAEIGENEDEKIR